MCSAALHVTITEENAYGIDTSVFGLHPTWMRMHAYTGCVGTHVSDSGNKLSNLVSVYTHMIAANSVQLPSTS